MQNSKLFVDEQTSQLCAALPSHQLQFLSISYIMITSVQTVGFSGQKRYLIFFKVQNGLGYIAVWKESLH